MTTPPLGWIKPIDRTKAQEAAHATAMQGHVQFALPVKQLAPGQAVRLFDFWKHPLVVADTGKEFARSHQLTGSCFPVGTPVRMADGSEKPIEDVRVGDRVITHTGKSRRVCSLFRRNYTGEMKTVSVAGFPFPLEMTADHKMARLFDGDRLSWTRAEDLEVDDKLFVGWDRRENRSPVEIDCLPHLGDEGMSLDELMKDNAFTKGNDPDVPNSNLSSARTTVRQSGIDWCGRVRLRRSRIENAIYRHVSVCPSLGRLIGLYLAEGGCHEGRVTFTFHSEEENLAAEVIALVRGLFGVEGEFERQPDRPTVLKVRFQNANLAAVLKSLVPGNVYTKRVPGIFFSADEATRLAIILGWMDGDGYAALTNVRTGRVRPSVKIQGVTACRDLARDMVTLALSCGLTASCLRRKPRKQSKEAWDVYLCGSKSLSLFPSLAAQAASAGIKMWSKTSSMTRFGYARKIKSIETRAVENLPVFDFEVEEDHSFIAGGLTSSNCVNSGGWNAVVSTICAQRLASDNPTKAFVPFTFHNYAMSRHYMGDDGQGEGSMGSTFAQSLRQDGIRDWPQTSGDELPEYTYSLEDGFKVTEQVEMKWSSYRNSDLQKVLPVAKQHLFGSTGECKTVEDIQAMIQNGYGVSFACNNYIGNASIKGSGANAAICGRWDGSGGHQQSIHAIWNNPDLGMLYWAQNNWDAGTYARDPAGGPVCGCWVLEKDVQSALRLDSEVYGLSHLSWFPAQSDKVLAHSQFV